MYANAESDTSGGRRVRLRSYIEAVPVLVRFRELPPVVDLLCTAGCGNVEEAVRGIGAGCLEEGIIGVLAPDIIVICSVVKLAPQLMLRTKTFVKVKRVVK